VLGRPSAIHGLAVARRSAFDVLTHYVQALDLVSQAQIDPVIAGDPDDGRRRRLALRLRRIGSSRAIVRLVGKVLVDGVEANLEQIKAASRGTIRSTRTSKRLMTSRIFPPRGPRGRKVVGKRQCRRPAR
jgi:hypothetical protein